MNLSITFGHAGRAHVFAIDLDRLLAHRARRRREPQPSVVIAEFGGILAELLSRPKRAARVRSLHAV